MLIIECYSKIIKSDFDSAKHLTRKGCSFEYAVPVTPEMYFAIQTHKVYSVPLDKGEVKVFCFKGKIRSTLTQKGRLNYEESTQHDPNM